MSDFWNGRAPATASPVGGTHVQGPSVEAWPGTTPGAAGSHAPSETETADFWTAAWASDTGDPASAAGAMGMGELDAGVDGDGGIPAEVLARAGLVFAHDGGYTYEITPAGTFVIVSAPGERGVGCEIAPVGELASAWRTLADHVVDMGPVSPGPAPGPAPGERPGRGPGRRDPTRAPGGRSPRGGEPRGPADGDPGTPAERDPYAGPDEPRTGAPAAGDLGDLLAQERLSPEEIDRARELIAELPARDRADLYLELQEKVEYANQRDNASPLEESDGGTCGLTAVAMALKALGVPNPNPEMQYEDALLLMAGGRNITAYSTWEYVAEQVGVSAKTIGSGVLSRAEWENVRDEHLAAGKGVVMSLRGHVVRLQGVDDRGLVVDDPYGATTLAEGTRRDRSTEKDIYNWTDTNDVSGDGPMAGEDLGYPWEDVLTYEFGTIFAFDR